MKISKSDDELPKPYRYTKICEDAYLLLLLFVKLILRCQQPHLGAPLKVHLYFNMRFTCFHSTRDVYLVFIVIYYL